MIPKDNQRTSLRPFLGCTGTQKSGLKWSNTPIPFRKRPTKRQAKILVAQRKKRISKNISVHHERDEKSSRSGTAGEGVEVNHNTPGLASQEAEDFGAIRT